jgi:hypothetical protein
MAETQRWQALPTQLELGEFEQFVLPHLSIGSRGPAPKLSLYKIFNYVLKILYLGCQWKELPIHKDGEGHPETHYTRIYRIWRRWVDNGCMDAIFADSVSRLHERDGLSSSRAPPSIRPQVVIKKATTGSGSLQTDTKMQEKHRRPTSLPRRYAV